MDTDTMNLKYNYDKLNTSINNLIYNNNKLNNKINELENKYNDIQRNYIILIELLKKNNICILDNIIS